MRTIRFKHVEGGYDMVNSIGFQLCLNRGEVKEFYRPSENRWVDPSKDPIRKRSDPSYPSSSDRRNN